MVFEVVDVLETVLPELGQVAVVGLLVSAVKEFGVHSNDQHVLVIRAVEDTDATERR